jgi:hypothetical protein
LSEWLHSLGVGWMAVTSFGFTYLIAALIFAVVVLPAGMRARARGFATGMLSPMGTVFALFLVFTAAQVWTDRDRAAAAVAQEASALRGAMILAAAFPGESQRHLESLVRSYIEETATTEWPLMAHQTGTLKTVPWQLAEALQLTLVLKPSSQGQQIAQHEITAEIESALAARRQRILISQSSVSGLKWAGLFVQAVCVLVTIALAHGDNRGAAIIAMGLFATGAATCLLLIVAYDRPFLGQFSIRPDPLLQVMPEALSPPPELNH